MDIEDVRKAYRRYARFYDFSFGAIFQPGREAVIRQLNARPGHRVLEVGTGTGLSLPAYPDDVEVVGIDISREMLARARVRRRQEGLHNVSALKVMDAENMAFPDNSFDRVVAMYVATVVPNPVQLVEEMRRVCKPDGEILIVNHFRHTNPVVGQLESWLSPLGKWLGFDPGLPLEEFLKTTHLDVAQQQPVNLFGYWTFLRARNSKAPAETEARLTSAAG